MTEEHEEFRRAWAEQLLRDLALHLEVLDGEADPALRGDHAAAALEALGGLVLLNHELSTSVARARASLDDAALTAWESGLRVERVLPRYRQQVVAYPDSILLGGARDNATRRPSPAVSVLETRQHLEQQRLALRQLERVDLALRLETRLAALDSRLRRELPSLLDFDDFEPTRRVTIDLAYGGDRTRAPWWCTDLRGVSLAGILAAVQQGVLHASDAVRDAILDDPDARAVYLDVLELIDTLAERKAATGQQTAPFTASDQASATVADLTPAMVRWPGVDEVLEQLNRTLLDHASLPRVSPRPVLVAYAADVAAPSVGTTPVVVVLGSGGCALLQVSVSYRAGAETGDPFAGARLLESVARDAVYDAFGAAARLTASGMPPAPFEAHELRFHLGDQALDAIDGRSLGLPLALAFLSAWTETPLPDDLVASADISREGKVFSAGELTRKAEAVAAWKPGARFLHGGEVDAPATGVLATKVGTLADAVADAGLHPSAIPAERAWLGDSAGRRAALHALCAAVTNQDLSDFRATSHPWLALAARMDFLVNTLSSRRDPETLELLGRARALTALAYLHAGDIARAVSPALLGDPSAADTPFNRTLRLVVDLSSAIDRLGGDDGTVVDRMLHLEAELRRQLGQLGEVERAKIQGQVFGTIGRAYLHRDELATALSWLRQALESHARDMVHEVPRSRYYLAMALRRAGDNQGALDELLRARAELELWTRPESAALAEKTQVFLDYELARVLLDRERPSAATIVCRHALLRAHTAGMGWPRQGILRTLAWARRELGEDPSSTLEELESLTQGVRIFERILAEARGPRRARGEVY